MGAYPSGLLLSRGEATQLSPGREPREPWGGSTDQIWITWNLQRSAAAELTLQSIQTVERLRLSAALSSGVVR